MYIETSHASRPEAGNIQDRTRPRIVVVDSDADAWNGTDLLAARYDLIHAVDARRGVEMARRRSADCVVTELDASMSSRYDILRELRNDARTRHVPIILLAGASGVPPALEALRSGADDYLVRPFLTAELVARIDVQLRHRRARHAEAAERLRLANLLHNDLQQLLVAAELRLGMAANRHPAGDVGREIATAREILAEARRSAQDLNRQLRPPDLEG
jgi:DNA-binding response OmpR family regulator